MFPVLFSIGKITITSYGVFLSLGFLLGIFLVWRLSRAWDLSEEKTLDLTILAFVGGLLGARFFFAVTNWSFFTSPLDFILINKLPGFSFFGGLLGGVVVLAIFAKRLKLAFWQVLDIASVGVLAGLIFSSLGCFFGGCSIGIPSNSFFAVSMVGILGKRWPVQILESAGFAFVLAKVWFGATHFHQRGKIVSKVLIYTGVVKLLLAPLKQDNSERVLWAALVMLGLVVYYRVTKQNPILQIKLLRKSFTLQNFLKNCYNQKTAIVWKLKSIKKVLKRSNVKFS